jgi:ribonuclease D
LFKFISRTFRRITTPRQIHPRPSREEIAALPPFDALTLENIVAVQTAEDAAAAFEILTLETRVGFDTESRPTFQKGEVSEGPHVVQFATDRATYVFTLQDAECRRVARTLIGSRKLVKVGFGLGHDRRIIPVRLQVRPKSLIDLEKLFAERGHGRNVGVKAAVAILLKRRFTKSKRISTSNWSRGRLSPEQLLYAANDAYAALRAYEALVGIGTKKKTE